MAGRLVKKGVTKKSNPFLYEINTSAWLYELSLEHGVNFTIGNVPRKEWDKLKALGFDYVWLMGVWKRSKAGITILKKDPGYESLQSDLDSVFPGWTDKDLTGSPYSIASYSPDPIIGKWKDIDKARLELNKRGMGLILDFVPNHTAPDHPWVLDHPDYYIRGSRHDLKKHPALYSVVRHKGKVFYVARGKDPFFPPWTDTVQMNFFNPDLRMALIREMRNIAKHCDGVRCDMAMLVLRDTFQNNWEWARKKVRSEPWTQEFWQEARRALPGFILIAEAYWDTEWTLQQMGFDYTYDKTLYDRLVNSQTHDVYLHLKADMVFQERLLRFIENHDEPRSARAFGKDSSFAAAVLFSTLPGLKLFHHGQLDGRKIKVPMQIRGIPPEGTDRETRKFYEKLLNITKQEIFRSGEWKLKDITPIWDESSGSLVAYVWKSDSPRGPTSTRSPRIEAGLSEAGKAAGKALKLVVVNLSGKYSQGRIPIEEITLDTDYILQDELNNRKYVRSGKDIVNPGLHVILEGYCAHIFSITPKK